MLGHLNVPGMMFASLLLVAASPTVPPAVAPPVEMPLLHSDSGVLKLNPACDGLDMSTVATRPACNEAFKRLEPAAVVPIARRTLAADGETAPQVIELLESSAAAGDHPTLHTMIGVILSTGQVIPPDYSKAVRHFRRAADAGNPLAALFLGQMLLEGRGTDRNILEGLAMARKAASLGAPKGATDVALMYFSGQILPKDETLGRTWIDATAAAGDEEAKRIRALIAAGESAQTMQVMPAAKSSEVEVVSFGPLSAPPVRSDYGFTRAFAAVHDKAFSDPATLAWLEANYRELPTPFLFEFSRRLAGVDPARAKRMLHLGQMRMAYDVLRCSDPKAAAPATAAWTNLVLAQAQFLTRTPVSDEMLDEILELEQELSADQDPWWVCWSGLSAMAVAAMPSDIRRLNLKPRSNWPMLREQSRTLFTDAMRKQQQGVPKQP